MWRVYYRVRVRVSHLSPTESSQVIWSYSLLFQPQPAPAAPRPRRASATARTMTYRNPYECTTFGYIYSARITHLRVAIQIYSVQYSSYVCTMMRFTKSVEITEESLAELEVWRDADGDGVTNER